MSGLSRLAQVFAVFGEAQQDPVGTAPPGQAGPLSGCVEVLMMRIAGYARG